MKPEQTEWWAASILTNHIIIAIAIAIIIIVSSLIISCGSFVMVFDLS